MKAVVWTKYGSPDVLQLKEIIKPTPKDDEVLIKVFATSINDWECGILNGKPYLSRILSGFLKPRIKILGIDLAGQVEVVGRNVKQFKFGDKIFGDLSGSGFGGFAEFVCAHENALALKPAEMTFEHAAAIPHTALLALQGLHKGQIKN